MNNKDILDLFGKIIVEQVFDNQYKFILNDLSALRETESYKSLFSNMSESQKLEIENYTCEILKGSLFDFLRIFEEYEDFQIVYNSEGKKTDLNKISEMLKSEPIIKNGWIDRFSNLK